MARRNPLLAPAVQLTEVVKEYRSYERPADRLWEIFNRNSRFTPHRALDGISLSIHEGETFGVIGENGAGKSTLLKLVAGTSNPTKGAVTVHGKVAALLELGTGFHPAETGRQNVYLLGALNGVGSKDMDNYFRQAVAFSELPEEVLNRPVKTYSTGMFMRLAFAVATNVDPDVLVIDEALSVGDMHFQKKSLDRIMSFCEGGKTVLFCSHNLYQIRTLCSRVVWLHQGQLMAIGETEEVVARYESYEQRKSKGQIGSKDSKAEAETVVPETKSEQGTSTPIRIRQIDLLDEEGTPGDKFKSFSDMSIRVRLKLFDRHTPYHVGIIIHRSDHERIFGTGTHFLDHPTHLSREAKDELILSIPRLPILSGDYLISVFVLDETGLHVYDQAEYICPFSVRNAGREVGVVYIPHEWKS